jgi:dolichol-phosphate mannosyltransferase
MSKLFIILPALNESEALTRLVPDLVSVLKETGTPYEILIVNDGSTDATEERIAEFARDWPVRELRHATNLGYGAALRTGFAWAMEQGQPDDIAVSLDCDNTHPPRFIPDLLRKITQGCDVVTASYTLPGGNVFGVPPLRRLTSGAANGLFRLAFPLTEIATYTNGFRAYRVSALRRAAERYGLPLITETGFPGGVELFLKVCYAGGKAGEIPFELHYENRGDASKIRFFRTIRGYLALIPRLRRQLS